LDRSGECAAERVVRWKPLSEQPFGWNPDLNNGVRINIRPFVEAGILRKTPSITWTKQGPRQGAGAGPRAVPLVQPARQAKG
jgi:hypothetical protein